MKKENISLTNVFLAKQEDREEWVQEEEESEDQGLNVKGIMALINDSPDDMCDIGCCLESSLN